MTTARTNGTCECGGKYAIGDGIITHRGAVVTCPRCVLNMRALGIDTYRRDRAVVIKHLAGIIDMARCGVAPDAAELVRIFAEADADVRSRAVIALEKISTDYMDAVNAAQNAAGRRVSRAMAKDWTNQ